MSILDKHYFFGKNLGIKKPHLWYDKSLKRWICSMFPSKEVTENRHHIVSGETVREACSIFLLRYPQHTPKDHAN